jgi:hypothetical protein
MAAMFGESLTHTNPPHTTTHNYIRTTQHKHAKLRSLRAVRVATAGRGRPGMVRGEGGTPGKGSNDGRRDDVCMCGCGLFIAV